MDTSLTELETDIGRLTHQQEQIRRQFFLHGDQPGSGAHSANNDTAKRKTWTVPSGGGSGGSSAPINVAQPRSQWGSPKLYSDGDNNQSEATPPRVYNGDARPAPHPRSAPSSSGSNSSLSYSSSFRLHSNADTQGNRLFGRQTYAS